MKLPPSGLEPGSMPHDIGQALILTLARVCLCLCIRRFGLINRLHTFVHVVLHVSLFFSLLSLVNSCLRAHRNAAVDAPPC